MSKNEPLFYTKIPVSVQALHYHSPEAGKDIVMWANNNGCKARLSKVMVRGQPVDVIAVPTLNGIVYAEYGEWVICGVKGEFYPCRDDIFRETYHVDEDGQPFYG